MVLCGGPFISAYLQSANEERPVIIPFVPAVLTQLFHPLITPANYGVLPLLFISTYRLWFVRINPEAVTCLSRIQATAAVLLFNCLFNIRVFI